MDNINVDITDDTQSVNIVITEETQDVTLHLEAVGEKGDKGDKGDTGEPAQVVPLCQFGDYCSGTITLTAPITDYQKLYFICGNDALQTITVLTDTTKHKLMWDSDNDESAMENKVPQHYHHYAVRQHSYHQLVQRNAVRHKTGVCRVT